MKRTALLATALAVLGLAEPVLAASYRRAGRGHWGESQALRLQFGLFTPRGDSEYWDEKALDFTGDADSFEDLALGIEYLRYLGPRMGLLVGGNFYEGDATQVYRDFVDERGFDIGHDTELDIASFTVGLLAHLRRRDAAVVPYVGVGGGLYAWRLSEDGDFIDFGPAAPEIFTGFFEAEGTTLGYYLQAGLEVPIGSAWTVFADARWQRVTDELEDDFTGFGDLDLGGRSLSLGVAWSF